MTAERTLRRKLQKKKKRKPYYRCPKCGERAYVRVEELGVWEEVPSEPLGWRLMLKVSPVRFGPRLFAVCGTLYYDSNRPEGYRVEPSWRGCCGWAKELFWRGKR